MKKEQHFIEEFALYFEETGFMRMAGRILAYLLICDPPHQSMGDIVKVLQASKSSVSTTTRQLIQAGFIEKISLPGHRRDYYRLRSDFASASVERFFKRLEGFGEIAEHWLNMLEGVSDIQLQRLKEMRDVNLFMGREMPKLLKRWNLSRSKKTKK